MASDRNPNVPLLRRTPNRARSCDVCRGEGRFYSHLRRIYVRAERGRGYLPLGYVCAYGHVELDEQPAEAREG